MIPRTISVLSVFSDAASSIDPASEAEGSQIGRNFASGGGGGDGVKLEGTSVGTDSLM